MKTGSALVLVVAASGLFWLSPRIHPFVLPARHADRCLSLFASQPPIVDRERDERARDRFAEAIRAERVRVLAAIPALGNPPCTVVTVLAGVAGLRPQELAVDRPRGCRFAGNEPVLCGDALVGFTRPDGGPSVGSIGRIRLLANDETRLRGTLDESGTPTHLDFGLVGSASDGVLRVRLVTELDPLPEGAAATTAPGDPSVPAGLRIGRTRARRVREGIVVEPDVDAARQLFLVVAHVGSNTNGDAADDDGRFRCVDARVIATGDAAPGRVVFALDRGSESGIVPGCAVTRGRTLVGRVLRAGPRASQVLAPGDPAFRVRALALDGDAMLRAFTLAGSSDAASARLRCDAPASPASSSEVVTALGEDEVPAGLRIGEVADARAGWIVLHARARASADEGLTVWIPQTRSGQ